MDPEREEKIDLETPAAPGAPAAAASNPPPPALEVLPPAAEIVRDGKTEREISLEAELEAERQARKKAETTAAYAEDEAKRLKEIQSRPAPAPAPRERKPRRGRSGFTTLLHSEPEPEED